ncbi:transcription factor bHLH80-like [Silene latifolia]|uniref:transcription factor bHLH80-like n=1 Tax=Silene latifolia TaxID=37657 RepID=UPI003D77A5E4
MQDHPPGSNSGRVGLTRFCSAPVTWLDALLNDPEPEPFPNPDSIPVQSGRVEGYVQPTTVDPEVYDGGVGAQSSRTTTTTSFHRMNSLPADFLGSNIDGSFSGFGFPATYSDDLVGQRSGELATANSLVEMEMEKLLEDSVACRVRAKRGCATHPRSIAERVRRTKISDRIRKLQELVPNMDKQTNTADMLEEAVEYVKTLQRQIQELTEQQKKCKCMPKC